MILIVGVYLLLDNPNVRNYLWIRIAGNVNCLNEAVFPIRILLSILIVFGSGILIEYVRQRIENIWLHSRSFIKLKIGFGRRNVKN
jgi:hypothetical protein